MDGILARVGDVGSLTGAIRSVYRMTKQQRVALGQSARRRAKVEFSLSSMVSNYIMLYRELFEVAASVPEVEHA